MPTTNYREFEFADETNIVVMSKADGIWAVELFKQNMDSIVFAEFDNMDRAVTFAHDLRSVMQERAYEISRQGEGYADFDAEFHHTNVGDGEDRFGIVISGLETMIESEITILHVEHASGMTDFVNEWCDEWTAIYNSTTPDETRSALLAVLDIVTDNLFPGEHFTCDEADTIADILRSHVSGPAADQFLLGHACGDVVGDRPAHLDLAAQFDAAQ